jgi:hypothetical protein
MKYACGGGAAPVAGLCTSSLAGTGRGGLSWTGREGSGGALRWTGQGQSEGALRWPGSGGAGTLRCTRQGGAAAACAGQDGWGGGAAVVVWCYHRS